MGRLGSLETLESRGPLEVEENRRTVRRGGCEHVQERLDLLERQDRFFLKMHLGAGSSLDEIAQIAGVHRSTVCRRLQRLIRRLSDETYWRCARDRIAFSPSELEIIRDRFVRGRSLARLSRDHHLCCYRVRLIVRRARRCAEAAESALLQCEPPRRTGDGPCT